MKHLSIRFLIGLVSASDDARTSLTRSPEDRAEEALRILSSHYPALSSVRGVGYWKGQAEPNLQVETIQDLYGRDRELIERDAGAVAQLVAQALNQESVALAVSEVRFTLEGPNGAV